MVEIVQRELPDGLDWLYIEQPDGRRYLLTPQPAAISPPLSLPLRASA